MIDTIVESILGSYATCIYNNIDILINVYSTGIDFMIIAVLQDPATGLMAFY